MEDKNTPASRLTAILSRPNLLAEICDNVASGGSLIDLAETWQIRYCDLMRWLNIDPIRKKQYDQAITDRGEWFIQRVLKEIHLMGTVDFAQAFDKDGNLKSPGDMPEAITRCINSIDIMQIPNTTATVKKLKFESKLKALEMLGKNMFMFVEKKVVLNGDANDSKFRDEFFGIGTPKQQQGSTTTGEGEL